LIWPNEAEGGEWLMVIGNAGDAGLFLHDMVIEETSGFGRAVVGYLPRQLDKKKCMIVTTRTNSQSHMRHRGGEEAV
jgi:hypothetical protein